jgi:hypothetical protein
MNRSSITSDIVKNLRRGQTIIVQKRDSNSWTVTVQVFVDEKILTILEVEMGSP